MPSGLGLDEGSLFGTVHTVVQGGTRKSWRDFGKQLGFLLNNFRHPSLQAKKYDEARDIWQARVNDGWRFYFRIESDVYHLIDIIPHPK